MPTYAYKCSVCDNYFELRQSFDAATITDCPKCGKQANRQISAVPIVFKGSGWYVNDYGKKASSFTSSPAAESNGVSTGSSDARDERREKAHESMAKPSAPAAPAASSTSSSSSSAGSSPAAKSS